MDAHLIQDIGGREYMEDMACLLKNFNEDGCLFGGIYDGHAGSSVAESAKNNLPHVFLNWWRKTGRIDFAFTDAYKEVSQKKHYEMVGCTALSFLKLNKKLFIANAGDSRLIILRDGKIDQVTTDHNIKNKNETRRVTRAGGYIEGRYLWKGLDGRMCTRALGDHYFNSAGLISDPEIFTRELISGDIIIAASDGIWDEASNETVVSLIEKNATAKNIAKTILYHFTNIIKARDNLSLIIVKI